MSKTKTFLRLFTIADYEEEEQWLRSQHQKGWKLQKIYFPCFYVFEKCQPEDVVYRLDYQNKTQDSNYHRIFEDYGWEYCQQFMGWLFFRKPVTDSSEPCEYEIFSDNESRIDMIEHIIKTRMLPIMIIFFTCLLPNFVNTVRYTTSSSFFFTMLFGVLTVLYVGLVTYCGIKLRRLRAHFDLPPR